MPCPLNCTEPCQECYEKTRADGVKEYACYGRCVVVDQMGISHKGPGKDPPTGFVPFQNRPLQPWWPCAITLGGTASNPGDEGRCGWGNTCTKGSCYTQYAATGGKMKCACLEPNDPRLTVRGSRWVKRKFLQRLRALPINSASMDGITDAEYAAMVEAEEIADWMDMYMDMYNEQTPPTDPPTIANHCGNCTSSFCNDVNGVEHKCWTKTDASGRTCKCWSINEKGLTGAGWIPDNTIHRGDTNFGVDRPTQITNINNSEQTPTSATNCYSEGKPCHLCTTNCWINRSDQVPYECYCGEQPKLQDGTPNPKWKKFKNPNTQKVDRLTQTTEEEQKAALTVARLNFNKRIGGGGTPVPIIPKQYTTIECDPKWCNCQGVPGCGDAAKCGGQCYWVNHPRVGGTLEPPGACKSCNFKCSQKGNPPESDEDDVVVIRETEQVPKAALGKARRAANFDGTMQTAKDCCNGGPCDTAKNICYRNTDGKRACVCHPLKLKVGDTEITMPPLPAADGWLPFVSPPPPAQFQTPPAPDCCHRKPRCDKGYGCWQNTTSATKECICVKLGGPPLGYPWRPVDQITPPTPMY